MEALNQIPPALTHCPMLPIFEWLEEDEEEVSQADLFAREIIGANWEWFDKLGPHDNPKESTWPTKSDSTSNVTFEVNPVGSIEAADKVCISNV